MKSDQTKELESIPAFLFQKNQTLFNPEKVGTLDITIVKKMSTNVIQFKPYKFSTIVFVCINV